MASDPISESAARTMGNFERPETYKVFKLCREGHYKELASWLQSLNDQQGKIFLVLQIEELTSCRDVIQV